MKISFFLLLISSLILVSCQTQSDKKDDNESSKPLVYNFPDDWKGHWEGTLEIWTVDSVLQTVRMQLIIEGEDSISWNIIYGEESEDNRGYFLRQVNAKNGHYLIDEMDGIELDCYVKGNKLISGFDVQGSFLSITEEMTKEGIVYEVVVYDAQNYAITSQTPSDSVKVIDPKDLIKCYKNLSYQKALLKKI